MTSLVRTEKLPGGGTITGYGPKMDAEFWDNVYKKRSQQVALGAQYGLDIDPASGTIKGKLDSASGGGGSGGSGSTSASSGLFGGDLGGTFNSFADSAMSRAKDWAQFQLGINRQQSEQNYDFRNREATRDFGFNTALAGQQIEGNKSLEGLRQSSETDRLQRSLTSQQTMQQADFSNQTQQRAQQAALARLGFAGRR